jgi:peptidoglycan/LPS O-acetylase OafA/YrhL
MHSSTSTFLNTLRVVAALAVFVCHCAEFWFPPFFLPLANIAHGAVVIFFVISGYVIAFSTFSRERDLKRYAMARISRLYSVVMPALVLTAFLQVVGRFLNPSFYAHFSRGFDFPRYVLTGLFLQNFWVLGASPPSNAPFWSLAYEFWYYALFGAFMLIRPCPQKAWIVLAISLIAGPEILLLLPCWLVGVVVYLIQDHILIQSVKARMVFVLSVLALLSVILWLPQFPFDLSRKGFWCSGRFLTDWITAIVAGSTIIFFNASQVDDLPAVYTLYIGEAADRTFSLYLYHFPLIIFATATIPFDKTSVWQIACIAIVILAVAISLSVVTEAKRGALRRVLELYFDRIVKHLRRRIDSADRISV